MMKHLHQHEELFDRVLELVVLLNEDLERGLGMLGLTLSRAHLLWELWQRGPVTQQALAAALKITPRAVTGLVDALVASGLVTREPHPSDRRAALVTFTTSGKTLIAQMARDHETLAHSLFGPMRQRELDAFAGGLADVIERLRVHVANGSSTGAGRPPSPETQPTTRVRPAHP
jgi:DNA-binding MarR family transcriptional regulator